MKHCIIRCLLCRVRTWKVCCDTPICLIIQTVLMSLQIPLWVILKAFFFLCTACQAAGFFWCEYKMFYFRRAESCSLWLITHDFPTATVSGSPLPLQQTHKKKLAEFTWCRQVKSNMSVIVSRCDTGHWCEVSVCASMLKWMHQKVPASCINLVSAPFHSSVPWIIS